MDVNNIGQSSVNLNSYSANVSEYTQKNTEVAVPKIQEVTTQIKDEKDNKNQEYTTKELDNAMKKINNFLKDEKTRAEYSFHKDFGTLMIKIIDEDTNEVILETPPKKILDMVASMCRQVGLFDRKA
ncbi:flagellar protein FlaG [Clostridium saccharobutylicum]|uniref:Flagellar protein FlaG protein n=1 Tax=Clostridium saccharobutylicum DSM 13864 TaxID=1345695 RepID=U5MWN5_CLOSA|nr:flagellar protein FlaG [Clostridium saccharobutylicum]AGX44928.1 flagellar protein FlaG protein [Clostridium saccharobutylicum DSM 13864]AQR92210.1 flagellar protein FlaG [Clostridium saccharobutylicum]AQS02112.1 flagellar protein FlaG [Clostridium saccharobutylicum]AQS11716.1 flagellar protein FlaG [Clostridium saccharobutylicum]AQS16095.1 flagellar protein FlaG [Clostridium saccharobutylicum]